MDSNEFCVLWNNYYQTLSSNFEELRRLEQLVDVTLVCPDGGQVLAHQVVLAACSSFFRDFIKTNPSRHPTVLLPSDFHISEVKSMVEFMYSGQVSIPQGQLKSFIKGARYLRIKGLEDSEEDSDFEGTGMDIPWPMNDFSEGGSDAEKMSNSKSGPSRKEVSMVQEGKWSVVDKKPVILPSQTFTSKKRRKKTSSFRRNPMHLSNSIVCYENMDKTTYDSEPVNKIRRLGSPGHHHCDEDTELCWCASRKIWSVDDTEGLLDAWKQTLLEVPPSYFIRSMSLCRRVSSRLQKKGIRKNWRQCQVKMKNLRREARMFKEPKTKNKKSSSEVANACEKLMSRIEEIFNKEEEIRQDWYRIKGQKNFDRSEVTDPRSKDLLSQVVVLAETDDDTDRNAMDTENEPSNPDETEEFRENEDTFVTNIHAPHYTMHTGPDGVVHHIVEDVSLHVKDDPDSNVQNLEPLI